MWSDRLPEKRRRRLAQCLQAVVPAPAPGSRGARTPLRPGGKTAPSPLQVAEELRELPGFAWLDGGEVRRRRNPHPRAVVTVTNGGASVLGPGCQAAFRAGGFDLLEAAFAAWSGAGA